MQPLPEQMIARAALGSAGASGDTLERVTLRDGRELIRKQALRHGTGSPGR